LRSRAAIGLRRAIAQLILIEPEGQPCFGAALLSEIKSRGAMTWPVRIILPVVTRKTPTTGKVAQL
jgi:hypothetical protein